MGFETDEKRFQEEKAEREERDANPEEQWEYLARNLGKVPGIGLEDDFNRHGQKGWEFVAVVDQYTIFKGRKPAINT